MKDSFSTRDVERELLERMNRIEDAIRQMAKAQVVKHYYTIEDVAAMLEKAPFTVREWARLGRIRASKALTGRGHSKEWRIAKTEIDRVRAQGLLPRQKSNTEDRAAE
jgi:hypothetical protein